MGGGGAVVAGAAVRQYLVSDDRLGEDVGTFTAVGFDAPDVGRLFRH